MGKFSSFFHCRARRVSPFLTCFLSLLTALGAPPSFFSFLGILGLAFLSVLGREAGGFPTPCSSASLPLSSAPPPPLPSAPPSFWGKSTTTGSTPNLARYSRSWPAVSTVLASFRRGWEWMASIWSRFSSSTRVTSFSALLAMASGPTQPLAHPSLAIRTSSEANRRLTFPSSWRRFLPRDLVSIWAAGVVVRRYRPCFLSLKKRFLVWLCVDDGRGTLATSSSAVMHGTWP